MHLYHQIGNVRLTVVALLEFALSGSHPDETQELWCK